MESLNELKRRVRLARLNGDAKTIHYYYSLIESVENKCLIAFLNESGDDRLTDIINLLKKRVELHENEIEKLIENE